MKGASFANDRIREVHNSFARPDIFLMDDKKPASHSSSEDLFHFIAYVPIDGSVYEIDGLQEGPYHLGSYDGVDWMPHVKKAIKERIALFSNNEIRFNLMSIQKSKKAIYSQQIETLMVK